MQNSPRRGYCNRLALLPQPAARPPSTSFLNTLNPFTNFELNTPVGLDCWATPVIQVPPHASSHQPNATIAIESNSSLCSHLTQGHVELSVCDIKSSGGGSEGSARVTRRNAATTLFMCIISRRSCRRPGVRYETRGVDARGNVANFVETEFFVWREPEVDEVSVQVASYVIIRGSIPVYVTPFPHCFISNIQSRYWHQPLSVMRFGVQYVEPFPKSMNVTLFADTTLGLVSITPLRKRRRPSPRTPSLSKLRMAMFCASIL